MWEKLLLCAALVSLIGGAISQQQEEHVQVSEVPEDTSPSETEGYESESFGCKATDPSVPIPIKKKQCKYILSILSVQQSGQTGHVCIRMRCDETVQATVTFLFKEFIIPVFSGPINASTEYFECHNFQVPTLKEKQKQLAYVELSITGVTIKIHERKNVLIDRMPTSCITQADKSLYQPGDTVKCRMFCVDFKLKPIDPKCVKIYFVDQTGARAAQISNPDVQNGLVKAEFAISENGRDGSSRIEFHREGDDTVVQYIEVKKHIPPRFDSTVKCPSSVLVSDKLTQIQVYAEYVYDKPFSGTVIAKCNRNVAYASVRAKNCWRGVEDISVAFTGEMDSKGTYRKDLNLDQFELPFSVYDSYIQCTFTVKEAGTGVLDTKHCYIQISTQEANLYFDYDNYDPYYKNGLHYVFRAKLTNQNGEPIPYENITVEVDGTKVKTVITDVQGIAKCGIDTTQFYNSNYTIRISYQKEDQCYFRDQQSPWRGRPFSPSYPHYYPEFPYDEMIIYRTFSDSNSFIHIVKEPGPFSCYKSHTVEVKYKLTKKGVGEGKSSIVFHHVVKAKQQFVIHGQQTVDLAHCLKGSFHINLYITPDCAYSAEMIVMALLEDEVMVDTMQLNVESCFHNQVSLIFTKSIVEPGAEVQQEITAAPHSICAMKTWDARLDFLRPNTDLNPASILSGLHYYLYGLKIDDIDLREPDPPCEDPNRIMYSAGRYCTPTSSHTDADSYKKIESYSMVIMTNCKTKRVKICGLENDETPFYKHGADEFVRFASPLAAGASDAVSNVRSDFATTFLFVETTTGSDGKGYVKGKSPDSITKWRSKAFCMSGKEGLGLTNKTAEFTAILPMFLEIGIPKFCTRGEVIIVDVTVVNNMENKCIMFKLSFEDSDAFKFESSSDNPESCICHGERSTKKYSITFYKIGVTNVTISASTESISDTCGGPNDDSQKQRIDTVISEIKVDAEGLKTQNTTSYQITVKDSTDVKELTIATPENVVEGSSVTVINILGDPIGLTAAHFKNVLTQPDGCCEQKMSKLFPIMDMIEYYKFLGITDDNLLKDAINELNAGYSRMLGCRWWDGRFSVFPGTFVQNSWFIVRLLYFFERIKQFTYVDETLGSAILSELGQQQNLSTGCLHPTGSSFTARDETNKHIHFTACAIIYLSKSEDLRRNSAPLLERAKMCLDAVDEESLDTTTLAYVFHATTVIGLEKIRDGALRVLKTRATDTGCGRYWSSRISPPGLANYFIRPSSNEVDIAARVLMALMAGPEVDLNYASPIAAFLACCRNDRGGYISSQDSESASEALTKYAKHTYVKNTNCEVTVSQGDAVLYRVQVTEDNKLVRLTKSFSNLSGAITISVSGTGTPFVQVVHNYNVKIKSEESTFLLSVNARAESCTEGVAELIHMETCVTYVGKETHTRMVYMTFKSLTGYSPDLSYGYKLLTEKIVSHFHVTNNYMYLYWNSLNNGNKVCFKIPFYMESRVMEYQASSVIVAHYYDTEGAASQLVSHPCSPKAVG